jgi:hypothetical protein
MDNESTNTVTQEPNTEVQDTHDNTNSTTDTSTHSADTANTTEQTTGAPDRYDFTSLLGEGESIDEQNAEAFGEILRNIGVSQEGAEQIAKFGMGYLQTMGDALLNHIDGLQEAQSETWKEETVKELGSNFDTTIAKAGAGIEYLEKDIPNLREVLMMNGIGNNVALVKAFATIGDLVAEDTGRLSGQGSGSGVNFYDNTNFDVYRMK